MLSKISNKRPIKHEFDQLTVCSNQNQKRRAEEFGTMIQPQPRNYNFFKGSVGSESQLPFTSNKLLSGITNCAEVEPTIMKYDYYNNI
jgi:hypothetical protein